VIHRDVKPGNVLLYEGRPMVSDFGIALAMSVPVDGRAGAGVPLGTPDYMSPEQAEGQSEITHRSDIYSLGCMLYEMLSGSRPFGRDSERSVSEQHAAGPVPDIRTVRPSVPDPVGRAIATAMAKAPADRHSTAGEFAGAIEPPDVASSQFRRRYRRFFRGDGRWLVNVAATVAFLLAGVWLTAEFTGGEGGDAEPAAAGMRTRQLTDDGNVIRAAISPDGSHFVRAVHDDRATARIVVSDIEGVLPERTLALVPQGPLSRLGWVPDGSAITFFGAHMGTIGQHLMPIEGGPVQTGAIRWLHARAADSDRIALWGPQWKQVLLMPESGWVDAPPAGSVDSIPVAGDYDVIQDVVLVPGGSRLIVSTFGGSTGVLRLINVADKAETILTTDYGRLTHLNWVRGGRALYYTRTSPLGAMQLMRLAFGADGLFDGEAVPVVELTDSLWVTHVDTDARSLVAVRTLVDSRLVRVSRRPGTDSTTIHPVTGGDGAIKHRTSPDGAWIAFMASGVSRGDSADESTGTGGYYLYRVAAAGGTPERISAYGGIKDFAWSPDGRFVAFAAPYQDTVSVWLMASDGGSPVRLRGSHTNGTVVWAPGPLIYGLPGNRNYQVVRNLRIDTATDSAALTPSNLRRAWNSIVTGQQSPLVGAEDGWMFSPRASPDGRWIAVWWNRQAGEPGVWRIPLSGSAQQLVQADTRDVRYRPGGWAPDGSAIIAATEGRYVRLPLDGPEPELIFDAPADPVYRLDCESPSTTLEFDIHCVELSSGSDAVLIENFDPQAD
jgi:Tol biopolymer transport system component